MAQRLALLVGLACRIAAVDLLIGGVKFQNVHHRAIQQLRVAGILHTNFSHHLADNDLNVLIVDVNALLTVHTQDLLDEVVVHCVIAADVQNLVGVQCAVGELGALFNDIAILHLQTRVRHGVGAGVSVRRGDDDVQQAALGSLLELHGAANLCQRGHTLGLPGLEQLLNTGKALRDVTACQTAGMEGTHGQLRTGLADGLGCDNADCLAGADRLLRGKVHAIALGAHTAVGLAGQNSADHDSGILVLGRVEGTHIALPGIELDPCTALHELGIVFGHHLAVGNQDLTGLGVHNIAHEEAAPDTVGELLNDLTVLTDTGDLDA